MRNALAAIPCSQWSHDCVAHKSKILTGFACLSVYSPVDNTATGELICGHIY